MRRSGLPRFLGIAAAAVVLVAVAGCDWWQPSFKRSPKLTLVLSERSDDISLRAPVTVPSGTEFYYLRSQGWWYNGGLGELWRAKTDGTQARLVVEGSFRAFALSRDGSVLALATDSGYLLLTNADGRVEDTLTRAGGTLDGVWFSRRDSERLYFRVDGHLHFAINLDGSDMHEVSSDSVDGFPSVQPSGHYALVTLAPDQFRHDLGLAATQTGDTTPLHASPYKYSEVYPEFSCWTPTESAIVFTSFEWRVSDPMRPVPSEIWKYEPVFDH